MPLELGRDGKFAVKSSAWEENKVIPRGRGLVIRVEGARWFITKQPASANAAVSVGQASDADEILEAL